MIFKHFVCESYPCYFKLYFNSRSYSKESSKDDAGDRYEDDEFTTKLDKDALDREEPPEHFTRGYRRDGRQGPTPKFRAYTSEEVKQREASQSKHDQAFIQCPECSIL